VFIRGSNLPDFLVLKMCMGSGSLGAYGLCRRIRLVQTDWRREATAQVERAPSFFVVQHEFSWLVGENHADLGFGFDLAA
jgi:hypothetical protein